MPINKKVVLCGAKSRRRNGLPCRQPAMKNGRCRMHGGKCTGPKTKEGKRCSARANIKHGLYTKASLIEKKRMREIMKWRKEFDAI